MSMEEREYARVQGDQVVEYPVLWNQIIARGGNRYDYLPVVKQEIPQINAITHDLLQFFDITPINVTVRYEVKERSLADVLASFVTVTAEGVVGRASITTIDPALIGVVVKLIADYSESQLTALAKEQQYESLDTILGRYQNTRITAFRHQYLFVQRLLDRTWERLIAYQTELVAGTKPVPVTIEEIDQVIDLPTWAEQETFLQAEGLI